MINDYRDHAANERTYLAWVRTGIAVIAFGLVIERFNVFMSTLAAAALGDESRRLQLQHLSGPVGRYEGFALIVGGIGIVVLASVRFFRTTRLLDDPQPHEARSVRTELVLSGWLVLLLAGYAVYLALA